MDLATRARTTVVSAYLPPPPKGKWALLLCTNSSSGFGSSPAPISQRSGQKSVARVKFASEVVQGFISKYTSVPAGKKMPATAVSMLAVIVRSVLECTRSVSLMTASKYTSCCDCKGEHGIGTQSSKDDLQVGVCAREHISAA